MFHLLKILLIIIGLAVATYFALPYFGYAINLNHFTDRKQACQENISSCTKNLVEQGTKNATCEITCVDPTLIIKKN